MNFNEYPNWRHLNTTSGHTDVYADLLSLCQQWKRLRPDGVIHCLYWYQKGESPSEPSKELFSLLTTCRKYLYTGGYDASTVAAIREYWPQFAGSILSDEANLKYPK